jgi:hypothetical protein
MSMIWVKVAQTQRTVFAERPASVSVSASRWTVRELTSTSLVDPRAGWMWMR